MMYRRKSRSSTLNDTAGAKEINDTTSCPPISISLTFQAAKARLTQRGQADEHVRAPQHDQGLASRHLVDHEFKHGSLICGSCA